MTGFGYNVSGFGSFPSRGSPYYFQYLVVAGGGGGHGSNDANGGGGGGAGGYRTSDSTGFLTPLGTSYTVTVGAGGAIANNGSTSSLVAPSVLSISGTGGGHGGKTNTAAGSGGSGGGGGLNGNLGSGNSGGYSPVEGYNGLAQQPLNNNYFRTGGKGGGAGGLGQDAYVVAYTPAPNNEYYIAGTAGPGLKWLNDVYYASGGPSGSYGTSNYLQYSGTVGGNVSPTTYGSYYHGTAGQGSQGSGSAGSPPANKGGGGGGGSNSSANASAGASGVVIVRYAGGQVGTGGTVTSAGGFTYHTFTSSGTFVSSV